MQPHIMLCCSAPLHTQVAYCLCAVCRCIAGQLVSPLTLPLALLRDSAAFQRASSNKSSASEAPSTPGAAAAGPGSSSAAVGDSSQHHSQGAVGSGGGTAGQPMTRKLLFEMFAAWCEEGTSRGGKDEMRRQYIVFPAYPGLCRCGCYCDRTHTFHRLSFSWSRG
jgi:hypothetical protein